MADVGVVPEDGRETGGVIEVGFDVGVVVRDLEVGVAEFGLCARGGMGGGLSAAAEVELLEGGSDDDVFDDSSKCG